jgi:glycosyltransferase involved in cell wall biosynthesis
MNDMKTIPSQLDPPAPFPANGALINERTTTAGYDNSNGETSLANIRKLSIIIPAYNEENTIHLILNKIKQVILVKNIEKEVIIVNDCSKDYTEGAIQAYSRNNPELPITYLRHETNQGKGAAIHTGIKHATGDYLLIQDADLEYDPEEYNNLLKPIINGLADVVYGSRFMGGNVHRILFFWHSRGNRFLTFLCNLFSNLNLTDMETGYKVFRTGLIQQIHLEEKRFGFEPEITVKIAQIPHIKIYEVGISYYGRTYHEGKKIGWKDGVRSIYCIIKYSLFDHHTLVNSKKEKVGVTTTGV